MNNYHTMTQYQSKRNPNYNQQNNYNSINNSDNYSNNYNNNNHYNNNNNNYNNNYNNNNNNFNHFSNNNNNYINEYNQRIQRFNNSGNFNQQPQQQQQQQQNGFIDKYSNVNYYNQNAYMSNNNNYNNNNYNNNYNNNNNYSTPISHHGNNNHQYNSNQFNNQFHSSQNQHQSRMYNLNNNNNNRSNLNNPSNRPPHQTRRFCTSSSSLPLPANEFNPTKTQRYKVLPKEIDDIFKAAGVLLFSQHEGKLLFLLGREDRSHKKKLSNVGDHVYLPFGGKVEKGEKALETALREFNEETGYIFSSKLDEIEKQMASPATPKFWIPHSKYILLCLQIPYDATLCDKFLAVDKDTFANTDQVSIEWVEYNSLFKATPNKPFFQRENGETGECMVFFTQMFYLIKSWLISEFPTECSSISSNGNNNQIDNKSNSEKISKPDVIENGNINSRSSSDMENSSVNSSSDHVDESNSSNSNDTNTRKIQNSNLNQDTKLSKLSKQKVMNNQNSNSNNNSQLQQKIPKTPKKGIKTKGIKVNNDNIKNNTDATLIVKKNKDKYGTKNKENTNNNTGAPTKINL
ncbi:hypothetical protein CYY_006474 [Polysphondylium violaceum]|uniref:Nudix hydrolase domain-containing protein n=1 Tax=Polysphondylium violaceum TaxID=133409 RepID=A0A8J4UYY5_9MYCE|nr:hypothetical protein CYY_006474 [Polysphondylium violaceum]